MTRSLVLFALLPIFAYGDQIIMKNGDRVTGSIVKKDAANLTIKSVHFGTVSLPWDQIASLKSDKPLTVVLKDAESMNGPIATAPDNKIAIAGREVVAASDVVELRNEDEQKTYLRMLRPKLTDLWALTGNIGFAGTAGNAETHTVTVPLTVVRATRNDKLTINFNLIRAAATINGVSSPTASAIRGGWAYDRNVSKKTFFSAVNSYEHDRFQDLDLRSIFGGGVGRHLSKGERGFVDVTVGGDFNHESFAATPTAASFSRSLGELYWGDNIGWKATRKLSFSQSYRMFNNMTDMGEFRQNGDFTMSLSMNKHFTWNASASDRYLSNPSSGFKRNDFLYSTGFGFKLAR